jgi:hypothetical protein
VHAAVNQDDREAVAKIRGDSPWRRLALGGVAWIGSTVLLFLIALRSSPLLPALFQNSAVTLVGAALLSLPVSAWATRRNRPDYAALDRTPPTPAEPVEDTAAIGYRDASRPTVPASDDKAPRLTSRLRDTLLTLALVALVTTGGVVSLRHDHLSVLIANLALYAVVVVAVALGYAIKRYNEGWRRRRDLSLLARLEENVDSPSAAEPCLARHAEEPRLRVEGAREDGSVDVVDQRTAAGELDASDSTRASRGGG